MAGTVKVTLQIRHDQANDWAERNPILAIGEYGLESDTLLLKIGDGSTPWNNLPYLNNLDTDYFKHNTDGSLTLSNSFLNLINTLQAAAGQAITNLTITNPPVNDTDVPNKKYVDDQIAGAQYLKRAVVQSLPTIANADLNTIYLVPSAGGNYYEEYMVVNNTWDIIGETGTGGGSGGSEYVLPVATSQALGGVKADNNSNSDYLNVTAQGYMTLNKVSTTKLYVPNNNTLVIFGGTP